MNPATNQPQTGRRPIDLLSQEARKSLRDSRRAFRRSATARDRIGSTEDRLRDWERRVVAKGSSARKWRSLLEEGLTLIADSGGVQLEVRQVEQRGLELLREGMEALRLAARDSGSGSAERAYDLLDQCRRLRAVELELLDGTLAETHGILNLPRSAAPDQVLGMLERRRRFVTRIDSNRRDAERRERQAIGVLTGTTIPDSEPEPENEKGETPMAARKKRNPAPVEPRPAPEAPAPAEPEEPVFDQPVLGPLDGIPAELRRAADRMDSVRLEVEGRLAALVERLEVNHAAALEEEARLRGEVEEQLEEMRAERKGVEERVAAAESAAEELRARLTALEEDVAAERESLASERKALDARVRAAEQERDEALVLVTSLTRRLMTPGVEGTTSDEEE
ncbi:MAG: hypothetical protein ABFS86_11555 [Planctomycetota bacterium]